MPGNKQLRVLEILEATVGGTRRHLLDVVNGLDPRRFHVEVVGSARRDPAFLADVKNLRQQGIPTMLVPMVRRIHPWHDLRSYLQLRRIVRAGRYDIVHTHSAKAGFLGRFAAARAKVPAILHTPHHFPFDMAVSPFWKAVYAGLERRAAAVTDRIICVCASERESALRRKIAKPAQLTVIENGIAPSALAVSDERRAAVRRRLGIRDDQLLIGTVGRLSRQKGPLHFLRVCRQLAATYPDACFAWVGDGELRPQMEHEIGRRGLAARLTLTGHIDDVAPYYAALDVVVMSSLWEGLPYTLLEAMAAGRPVAAFAAGGIADVIEDGVTGRLTPVADIPAMVAAVADLIASSAARRRLGENARQALCDKYHVEDMVRALAEVYRECAA